MVRREEPIVSLLLASTFHLFLKQVVAAARTLSSHPVSKIAQENMDVFIDIWEGQVEELGKVLRGITSGGEMSKSKCNKIFIHFLFVFMWMSCMHYGNSYFSSLVILLHLEFQFLLVIEFTYYC